MEETMEMIMEESQEESLETKKRLFSIDRLALHLVDPSQPEPIYSAKEVDLASYPDEQKAVIGEYFENHLLKSWKAAESARTVAAMFSENSDIGKYYKEIKEDQGKFYILSRSIAEHFHTAVKGNKNILVGLLIILLVHRLDDNKEFMAFYKVETNTKNNIAFQISKEAENVLLGIAVRPVEEALPDPGDRVLKWAIVPHPTRQGFDLKVRDEVTNKNIAEYFFSFLGCKPEKTEKEQAIELLNVIPKYVREYHPTVDTKTTSKELIDLIQQEPVLTAPAIAEKVNASGKLKGFQKNDFEEALSKSNLKNLSLLTKTLRNLRLEYTLSNKVKIIGPVSVMENLVQEEKLVGGEIEIRIRTTKVGKKYV